MKKKGKPNVHEELEGFDIKIVTFGGMKTSFSIVEINEFLPENVEDKKVNTTTRRKNSFLAFLYSEFEQGEKK